MQAQYLPSAGLALWNRTRGLDYLRLQQLLSSERSLVKLWGQRNTLHLYPTAEWPLLHAALEDRLAWFEQGFLKRGGDPGAFETAVQTSARRLRRAVSLCRNDVKDLEMDLEEVSEKYWAGLFMSLERRGLACHAGQGPGNETRFAHRKVWAPHLKWNPPPAEKAKPWLARRYLRCYGPAAAKDFGYWWGCPTTEARRWLDELSPELIEVDLQGEKLLALAEDSAELAEKPPPSNRWPIRLLHRFDPLLLGLADKSWLISDQRYKQVWKSAGQVEAVLLIKGRIAGTWRYSRRRKGLDIEVRPFAQLSKAVRASALKQAQGVARFFDLPLEDFRVE